jgi:hypothetical protein
MPQSCIASWRASSWLTVAPRAGFTRRDVVEEIHDTAKGRAPDLTVVVSRGCQGHMDLNEPAPNLGEEISLDNGLLI